MATETVTSAEIGTSPESLLRGLFKRAEDRLTDDELLTVAMLGEQAQNIVGYIEILCDGIGCLVAEDSDRETGAGNFQCGDDVAPPTRAQLAGAGAFDAAMQRVGEVSAASYDRDGTEDRPAMVDALHEALQAAMAEGPEFRFGFLMPLTDLIDCHRLGLQATVQGLGDQNVQPLKETVTLPRALADRVSAALASASDMVLAIEYLSNQQPQDEVMAGSLYALKACVDKLDKAIGALSSEFPEAVAAAAEVAHV